MEEVYFCQKIDKLFELNNMKSNLTVKQIFRQCRDKVESSKIVCIKRYEKSEIANYDHCLWKYFIIMKSMKNTAMAISSRKTAGNNLLPAVLRLAVTIAIRNPSRVLTVCVISSLYL